MLNVHWAHQIYSMWLTAFSYSICVTWIVYALQSWIRIELFGNVKYLSSTKRRLVAKVTQQLFYSSKHASQWIKINWFLRSIANKLPSGYDLISFVHDDNIITFVAFDRNAPTLFFLFLKDSTDFLSSLISLLITGNLKFLMLSITKLNSLFSNNSSTSVVCIR